LHELRLETIEMLAANRAGIEVNEVLDLQAGRGSIARLRGPTGRSAPVRPVGIDA